MIEIMIHLQGQGWAEIEFSNGEIKVAMLASMLSDSLCNLVNSTASLIEGHSELVTKFQAEPGEYRIITKIFENGHLNLQLLEFEKTYSTAENNVGKVIFEGTEDIFRYAKRIQKQFDKLIFLHGEKGFHSI